MIAITLDYTLTVCWGGGCSPEEQQYVAFVQLYTYS